MTRGPQPVVFYLGDFETGGAQRQTLELLRHLDRSRFIPRLCLAHGGGSLLAELPADVTVSAFPPPRATAGSRLIQRLGWLRRSRQRWLASELDRHRAALVVDRTYLASLDTAGACRWRPTPRISTVVADPQVQFERYARFPRWLHRRIGRDCYQRATCVVANSSGLADQLASFWKLPRTAITVLPNGVDFDRLRRNQSAFDVDKPPSTIRLLTIGRIDADKHQQAILEALTLVVRRRGARATPERPALQWQVIGEGPLKSPLEAAAAAASLESLIDLLPPVSNPAPYYAAADVYVLSSRSEGLPNVLIEALGLGLPVIATDCPFGPREILAEGDYGRLVPMDDAEAMAQAIEATVMDLPAAKAQAARAAPAIEDRFGIGRVVTAWEALFDRAIHEGRRAE